MKKNRSANLLCLSILGTVLLAGCAAVPGTPAPKSSPAGEPRPSGTNPAARLGLSAATGIEILAFVTQGPGGQPGYVPRLAISDAAAVAQVVGTLNTDTKELPGALCVPEYELRFRLRDGAVKKLMYSCEGASFLRSDDPAWGVGDLQPPAAFDKLMKELLATGAPTPPAASEPVPEVAELARDTALVIMDREQPGQAPSTDLKWQAKRLTPPGILGYEQWQFTAGSWVVTVGYPVTRPDQVVYAVVVTNEATGKKWERELSASQVPMRFPVPSGR